MTSEETNGKASSSGTRSPLVANDGEIPENVSDDVVIHPIGDEDESLEGNSAEEIDSDEETASAVNPLADETASAVNPVSSDAAQILPLLQNLLLNNDIQRERLLGLTQLYDPSTAEETNAMVNAEGEQTAREAELSSRILFLEQSVQRLEEELENQKKLNAQLEEQIKRLNERSDP